MKVDAVILAGRYNTGKLQAASPARLEAMIEIVGRPMVDYVIEALVKSDVVGRIVLVGPGQELEPVLRPGVFAVEPVGDVLANLRRGMATAESEQVMVCTSDIPLLSPASIRDFLHRCRQTPGADFYMPVVSAHDAQEQYPEMKRTYGRIKEGRFTGGNIFLVSSRLPETVWKRAEEFVASRKSVFRLASLLGLSYILKLLVFRPSIPQLEARVEKLLGAKCRAVLTPYVELVVDCDKESDLEVVEKAIKSSR
ncbi:MAG: nucleotidyltransferase family protein [Bacillota bacterium]